MDEIIVIDDAVDFKTQEFIKELCVGPSFGWIFNGTSAYFRTDKTPEQLPLDFFKHTVDTPLFTHTLWYDYGKNSMFCDQFFPIIDAIPFVIDKLIRVKVNLTVAHKDATADTYSIPHVDMKHVENCITALYYINDSDGDTVIFNEKTGHLGHLTVKQRVTPKQGRLVVFDGSRYHSGNNPSTDAPRLNLNINFLKK